MYALKLAESGTSGAGHHFVKVDRKMAKYLVLLSLLTLGKLSYAFNYVSHVAIAETTYSMLDKRIAGQLNKIACDMIDSEPDDKKNHYDNYQGVTCFSKIAITPDIRRNHKLSTIYKDYDADLQSNLIPIQNQVIRNWHFINFRFEPENQACDFIKRKDNVVWTINLLIQSYNHTSNDTGKALVLSSLLHYVADIHQPLHTVSRDRDTGPGCLNDLGGNKFCLSEPKNNGDCRRNKNLHSYWDQNTGTWTRRDDLSKYVKQLKSASDKLDLIEDSLDPYEWAKESWSYAEFAYGTPEGKKPNRAYRAEAQEIIMNRMALAAVRLKLLIEGLETPN